LKDSSWVLLALVISFAFAILLHHGVENKIHRSGISPKYLFGVLVLLVQICMALFAGEVLWSPDDDVRLFANSSNGTLLNLTIVDGKGYGCCRCGYDEGTSLNQLPLHRPTNTLES
jgi:hypothetical protein